MAERGWPSPASYPSPKPNWYSHLTKFVIVASNECHSIRDQDVRANCRIRFYPYFLANVYVVAYDDSVSRVEEAALSDVQVTTDAKAFSESQDAHTRRNASKQRGNGSDHRL